MPILKTERANDGQLWGYDSEAEDWVPIDEAAQGGSFLGNVGRAAGRGFEEVQQGVRELYDPTNPLVEQAGQELEQRQQAAGAVAPWAEMIGGAAPEAAGALATMPLTGGLGVLPTLLAEAGAAGTITALRPGSFEDRLQNAGLSAGIGLVGGAAALPIAAGIRAGMNVGGAILQKTTAATGRSIEAAAGKARALSAAERQAGIQQPGSAGAAATPEGQLGRDLTGEEVSTLAGDVRRGADISESPGREEELAAAQEHGWTRPWWADTRTGSSSRIKAGLRELFPEQAALDAETIQGNEALKARLAGRAMGLGDDPARTVVSQADLVKVEDRLEQGFAEIRAELPNIGNSEYMTALNKVEIEKGAVGADRGETMIANMKANLSKNEQAFVSPGGFMRDVQRLTAEMADAYKNGDNNSGDLLGQAVNHLYDLGERMTKQQPASSGIKGRTRDPSIVSSNWADVRREFQIYQMINAPGVRGPNGEINSQSLYRQMSKKRKNGGFGPAGPKKGSDLRPLWDVVVADKGAGKPNVPMTGVRTAMMLAKNPMMGGALGAGGTVAAANALGLLD